MILFVGLSVVIMGFGMQCEAQCVVTYTAPTTAQCKLHIVTLGWPVGLLVVI